MSFRILHGMSEWNVGNMTCNTVLSRGTAVRETSNDTSVVEACPSGDPLGFLDEAVTSDGPSYMELELLGGTAVHEVKSGGKVRILDGEGMIVTSIVATSGNRIMTDGSVNDLLTIVEGVWGVAQSGDTICGELLEVDYNSVSGDYRIKRTKSGYVKA